MVPSESSSTPLTDSTDIPLPPQIAALLRILPSASPRSLDDLATVVQAAEAMLRRPNQRRMNIFLTPEPPGTEVDRLREMFPAFPRDYILRHLMVTRDEEKTFETLLAMTRARQDSVGDEDKPVDPSPAFMGPFPRMMEVRYGDKDRPLEQLKQHVADTHWYLR